MYTLVAANDPAFHSLFGLVSALGFSVDSDCPLSGQQSVYDLDGFNLIFSYLI